MAEKKSNDWKEFLNLEEKSPQNQPVSNIAKRNGRIEKYDRWKIASAIDRAIKAAGKEEDPGFVELLTKKVEESLKDFMNNRHPNSVPAIEEIQIIHQTAGVVEKDSMKSQ